MMTVDISTEDPLSENSQHLHHMSSEDPERGNKVVPCRMKDRAYLGRSLQADYLTNGDQNFHTMVLADTLTCFQM